MNLLFLGYTDSPLVSFLQQAGENVQKYQDRIDPEFLRKHQIEFIISYGYRYILKRELLDCLPGKVINLHISLLPWNKGADPNFWSFVDQTPKGVTIHRIDPGLDTGDVLLQEEVDIPQEYNLRQSYELLQARIQQLFIRNWADLKEGKVLPKEQTGLGSYHRSKDKEPLLTGIRDQWLDMPIPALLKHISSIRKLTVD